MPRLKAIVLAALVVACEPGAATPLRTGGEERSLTAPPRAGFEPVADALVATCGTLDCHGQPSRNLRLFGNHGARLAAADEPGGVATTAAEYDANYLSVIGLEPEMLDMVVRGRGAGPERLTLILKPRGTETHKGGTLMKRNDPLDRCLLSWILGAPDVAACEGGTLERPDAGEP